MEKIIIDNFLIFDEVNLNINKFNILIGPQASGKSLLAKITFYFRNIFIMMKRNLQDEKSFESFIERLELEFLEFFPSQYWSYKEGFKIEYINNDITISIKSDFRRKNNFFIEFSSQVTDFYNNTTEVINKVKNDYLLDKDLFEDSDNLSDSKSKINSKVSEEIHKSVYKNYFSDSIFIPASRSFFSSLTNNVWTLTDQDIIDVDPFVSRFGRAYEQSKMIYSLIKDHSDRIDNLGENMFHDYNLNLKCLNEVIRGEYIKVDNKDWIYGNNYKVSLSRASSGQQESLPMLMVLIFNASRKNGGVKNFFIEEPEAHLFPNAQNDIVSLFLNLKNKVDVDFFITTHSPYILSSLNNSIYANDLIKKGKITVEQYIEMSSGAYPIDYEDISAYSLEDGKLIEIKNSEFRMIGGEILDEVSNEFGEVMDKLMMLDDDD